MFKEVNCELHNKETSTLHSEMEISLWKHSLQKLQFGAKSVVTKKAREDSYAFISSFSSDLNTLPAHTHKIWHITDPRHFCSQGHQDKLQSCPQWQSGESRRSSDFHL